MSISSTRYYSSNILTLDELSYWIAFSRVMGIGPVRFKQLLDFFQDDVASAWKADSKDLSQAGLDKKVIEGFHKQRQKIQPFEELERLEKLRVQVTTWKDTAYPPLLKKIEYAPPILYMCGKLIDDDYKYTMGVVGTRKMSHYGRQVTEHFTAELIKGQMTIVSGLALGVDTTAHTTALDLGGRTLAILACGLDTIYPRANYHLARRIVESEQGALVTAFPLGIRPEAGNFPARNHLISGLSLGILVTEAPERSGALITANSALTQGREVFAVPGNIFSPSGGGGNRLIHDGAHAVTNVTDILECLNLHLLPHRSDPPEVLSSRSAIEDESIEPILAQIGSQTVHIDEIIRLSGLPAHIVSSSLTILELNGMVKHMGGMYYAR